MKTQQPRFLGHVRERAVPIVLQQGERLPSQDALPAAAQHQHVGETIVVVIGLQDVQPAQFSRQARFLGALRECAVAIVPEETQRTAPIHRRTHDVEQTVPVKILRDAAAGQVIHGDTGRPCHFPKPWKGILGLEPPRIDAPARRHLVGVLAQRHVSDVQQPARRQIVRHIGQLGRQLSDGAA